MQFVQLLLTDDQASKVEQALKLVTNRSEDLGIEWASEVEEQEYLQLAGFFQLAAEEPEQFRPTGKTAETVRGLVRTFAGPAQPERKSPRKRSQARRQSFQRRTRAEKREEAEQYNAAVEMVEKDRAEMQEIYEEQLAARKERIDAALSALVNNQYSATLDLLELIGAAPLAAHAKTLVTARPHPTPEEVTNDTEADPEDAGRSGDGSSPRPRG